MKAYEYLPDAVIWNFSRNQMIMRVLIHPKEPSHFQKCGFFTRNLALHFHLRYVDWCSCEPQGANRHQNLSYLWSPCPHEVHTFRLQGRLLVSWFIVQSAGRANICATLVICSKAKCSLDFASCQTQIGRNDMHLLECWKF